MAAVTLSNGEIVRESLLRRVDPVGDEISYFARHTRAFRLVTRLFARGAEPRIARAYAWCRFMDDMADDQSVDSLERMSLLDEWMDLSRKAYRGEPSGIALLDGAMADMAAAGVPFVYAEELAEGMRMDLRGERYASMSDLERYTHRVASVVGRWVAELFGVRDGTALDHAARLGHALQLTNIIRDVGEDARMGRFYIPADSMLRHGVTERDIADGHRPAGYRPLMMEMIQATESAFDESVDGLASLPRAVRVPIAVAVNVYRGLLSQVRRNGYDNITRRAELSFPRKFFIASRAIVASVPLASPTPLKVQGFSRGTAFANEG